MAATHAHAIDVMPYTGLIDVTPISGCCKHVSSSIGFGILTRLPKVSKALGDIEIVGYSDFKYSEASLSKFIYLYGASPQVDPLSTSDTTITRLSGYTLTLSYGLGFFTHNTTTVRYELPALVAGLQAVSRLLLNYTITDTWSANALVSTGLGYSLDETDFNLGFGAGFTYRF